MTTWLLTIGNSDIQLKTEDNWGELYDLIFDRSPWEDYNYFRALEKDEETDQYLAPARVLGLVYGQQEDYFEDLEFPLLDVFTNYFASHDNPHRIVVILTEQEEIFTEDDRDYKYSPFWQDTCTLKPLVEKYLDDKLDIKPEFIYLKPNPGQGGIDHWDDTLKLVEKLSLGSSGDESLYVSHQAGTPAVSAAIQFLSISKSEQVQFLLSNQVHRDGGKEYTPQLIDSSRYWRGLQVQKAKKLITDGFPGAALELVRGLYDTDLDVIVKLKKKVDIFNIKAHKGSEEDFNVKNAITRVRQALDLIEIFFRQENYLQGITLLAAAQETFVKAAIVHHLQSLPRQVAGLDVVELVRWDNQGLFLRCKNNLEKIDHFQDNTDVDVNLAIELKFPIPEKQSDDEQDGDYYNFWNNYIYKNAQSKQFILRKMKYIRDKKYVNKARDFTINNNRGLKWLTKLVNSDNWQWENLKETFKYKREYEDDLRNQLMHNLRGMKKEEVIYYLLGNQQYLKGYKNVKDAYVEEVKKPFIKALCSFKLLAVNSTENLLQKELGELAESLH